MLRLQLAVRMPRGRAKRRFMKFVRKKRIRGFDGGRRLVVNRELN